MQLTKTYNYKTLLTNLVSYIVFFTLSAVFIYPYFKTGGMLGTGESTIYLNPEYLNYIHYWNAKINYGFATSLQANYVLFSVLWPIIGLFAVIAHPSVIFIFLSLFLACVSFYEVIKRLFPHSSPLLFILPSVFYSFNPIRLLGPLNERVIVFLILLPIIFYLYHKLISTLNWKYIPAQVFIIFLLGSVGANMPLYLISYLLMVLYLILFVLSNRGKLDIKNLLIYNLILFLAIIVTNLYWLYPNFLYLFRVYKYSNQGEALLHVSFNSLSAGTFLDHFRLFGSWSWRGSAFGNYYYPFHTVFDTFWGYLFTYTLVIVSFSYLLFSDKKNLFIRKFLVLLGLVSLILMAGPKEPFAYIYATLLKIPFFTMFREPFTKFSFLYLLCVCIALSYSLTLLSKVKNKLIFAACTVLLTMSVLFYISPYLTGQSMRVQYWNITQRGAVVKVPDYWQEFLNYYQSKDSKERLLTLPYSVYSSSSNWVYGVNVVRNIADLLVDNALVRGNPSDPSKAAPILNAFTEGHSYDDYIDLDKYLGFLNISHILVENDVEWRFSNSIASPVRIENYLTQAGLTPEKTFGSFTQRYLESLPNVSRDSYYYHSFINNLVGNYGLGLYEISKENINEKVYASDVVFKFITSNSYQYKYLAGYSGFLNNYTMVTDVPELLGISSVKVAVARNNTKFSIPKGTYRVYNSKHLARESSDIYVNEKTMSFVGAHNEYWDNYGGLAVSDESNLSLKTLDAQIQNIKELQFSKVHPAQIYSAIPQNSKIYYSDLAPEHDFEQLIIDGNVLEINTPDVVALEPYELSFKYKNIMGGLSVQINENLEYTANEVEATTYNEKLHSSLEHDENNIWEIETPDCDDSGCYRRFSIITYPGEDVSSISTIIFSYTKTGEPSNILLKDFSVKRLNLSPVLFVEDIPVHSESLPKVSLNKISPSKYEVNLKNVTEPFLLNFIESYSENWHLSLNGEEVDSEDHYMVNGFANSWYVDSSKYSGDVTGIIEFKPQQTINILFVVSFSFIAIDVILLIYVYGANIKKTYKKD